MLSLLAPLWLLGLTAIAVPIALHLWSRRGARPIRVGSIRLMLGAPPATRRSWRVQDPWLLLLRCAVLAALSLALTHPLWTPRAPILGGEATVALVSPEVTGADLLRDSLTRTGVAVRSLNDANYWTALRDAAATLPRGPKGHVYVFAPTPLLRRFAGERPALDATVEWRSRPAASQTAAPVPARTSSARIVAIYSDADRRDDARYVSAAIRAAALGTGIPAVITARSTSAPDAVGGAEWLVWLSSRPLPETLRAAARAGATVLQDATANGAAPLDSATITLASEPADARIYRRSVPSGGAVGGAPLWREGTGVPLLTASREGRGLLLAFRSRFHPSWSDLVLRPSFPEALAALWSAPLAAPAVRDDRLIALSQLLPAHDTTLTDAGAPQRAARSLFLPLWLLTVLLFGVERRWSSR